MGDMDEEDKMGVLKEIKLLDNMHHPNIVALKEAYDTKGGRKNIVMEVADGDDLDEEIKNIKMRSKL
jgi:serine/threonine protein kinase